MSAKNKHRSANEYLHYLRGKLSSRERHEFERGLEADPFEREAMEGLETLEPKQAEQDLLDLHDRLRKRLAKRRRLTLYSVAATVASLLIVGTVFLKVHDFNPSSEEKQFYSEESFDTGTPQETQALPPVQKEGEVTESESPAPEKAQDMAQATPAKESEPAKGATEGRSKGEPQLKPVEEEKVEAVVSVMATPAPDKENLAEDQITYQEAEPLARAEENREARNLQKAEMRKKSMAPARAEAPKEVSNKLINQTVLEEGPTAKVSGIVISAEDQGPIPGAIVENRALNSSVYTDGEGRFDMAVQPDSPATLVASYIGMETTEYPVEGGTEVELVLEPDPTTLDEVVVVGHEPQTKSSLASSTQGARLLDKKELAAYTGAEPSVGYQAYKNYMAEHLQFPVDDSHTEKAVVVLKFKISEKGEISEATALRSPGEHFSAEALRLLMEGPSWNPARNVDGPLDDWIRMRIVFKR